MKNIILESLIIEDETAFIGTQAQVSELLAEAFEEAYPNSMQCGYVAELSDFSAEVDTYRILLVDALTGVGDAPVSFNPTNYFGDDLIRSLSGHVLPR